MKGTNAKKLELEVLMKHLQKDVDLIMNDRMTYVNDLSSEPSDDEINYLATITDLASQIRTAVILAHRASFFKTKIQ